MRAPAAVSLRRAVALDDAVFGGARRRSGLRAPNRRDRRVRFVWQQHRAADLLDHRPRRLVACRDEILVVRLGEEHRRARYLFDALFGRARDTGWPPDRAPGRSTRSFPQGGGCVTAPLARGRLLRGTTMGGRSVIDGGSSFDPGPGSIMSGCSARPGIGGGCVDGPLGGGGGAGGVRRLARARVAPDGRDPLPRHPRVAFRAVDRSLPCVGIDTCLGVLDADAGWADVRRPRRLRGRPCGAISRAVGICFLGEPRPRKDAIGFVLARRVFHVDRRPHLGRARRSGGDVAGDERGCIDRRDTDDRPHFSRRRRRRRQVRTLLVGLRARSPHLEDHSAAARKKRFVFARQRIVATFFSHSLPSNRRDPKTGRAPSSSRQRTFTSQVSGCDLGR